MTEEALLALVESAEGGDVAQRRALFAALYDELHRMAQRELRRNSHATLSPTTLLHETFLNICERETAPAVDRGRFMVYASRAMRGLMIDYIRTKRAQKRGGDLTFLSLEDAQPDIAADEGTLGQLDAALEELETIDPALAQLVDMHFFCGFTFVELAAMRGVSERTVRRDWEKARLLLHRTLENLS